jgi:site-specific DNA recombinase
MSSDRPIRRCAVYTRKSSEEGLEQDFNSLHAQREACEAFIASQRGEGWRLVERAYDDGGISGGTMERPALQRLLSDIQSGGVDVIVVYKVDRLTRSLADFAKMVEVFDRHGVSFVAVTQQFNTTTSMGRLTLNVLLSFAQFEREVTGERIRDKIAASKRKGMWMGGVVPLGYAAIDRKLVVVPQDAEKVRHIFSRYLASTGVKALAAELRRDGIRPGTYTRNDAGHFFRGALYSLLSNPVYIGEVRHKDKRFPGLHEPIIDRGTWERVQQKLKMKAVRKGRTERLTEPSPLAGKIFDESGRKLMTSHAVKSGRRYRYYISAPSEQPRDQLNGWRLPAAEIEQRVQDVVRVMLRNRAAIAAAATASGVKDAEVSGVLDEAQRFAKPWEMIREVHLSASALKVVLSLPHQPPIKLERLVPLMLKRRGVERKLVIAGSAAGRSATIDAALVNTISRGAQYWTMLSSGEVKSIEALAKKVGLAGQTVGRMVPLGMLAPDIVEAIVEGRQPATLTTKALLHEIELPASWEEQRRVLGFE